MCTFYPLPLPSINAKTYLFAFKHACQRGLICDEYSSWFFLMIGTEKTRLWDTPNGQTLLCWQLLGKGTKLGTKKYLQFHDKKEIHNY